jgi:hypothetical protein
MDHQLWTDGPDIGATTASIRDGTPNAGRPAT